jgi:hypothetical protein
MHVIDRMIGGKIEFTRHHFSSRLIGDWMISSGMSSKNFLPQFMVFGLGDVKLHLGSKICASFTFIVHYKLCHRVN